MRLFANRLLPMPQYVTAHHKPSDVNLGSGDPVGNPSPKRENTLRTFGEKSRMRYQ